MNACTRVFSNEGTCNAMHGTSKAIGTPQTCNARYGMQAKFPPKIFRKGGFSTENPPLFDRKPLENPSKTPRKGGGFVGGLWATKGGVFNFWGVPPAKPGGVSPGPIVIRGVLEVPIRGFRDNLGPNRHVSMRPARRLSPRRRQRGLSGGEEENAGRSAGPTPGGGKRAHR